MCRFLLQHGADVDAISLLPEQRERAKRFVCTPLANIMVFPNQQVDLQDLAICRKLLLRAGSDPTVPPLDAKTPNVFIDAIENAFLFGKQVRNIS